MFRPSATIRLLLAGFALSLAVTANAALDAPVATRAGESFVIAADDSQQATYQGRGLTLEQAVAQVRRQYNPQRIISATTRRNKGRETHVIKILTQDNKVQTIRLAGRSGGSRD